MFQYSPVPLDRTELHALARLLDDRDPAITTAVQRRIVEYGHRAVPMLREIISSGEPTEHHVLNAQACLRAIQTEALGQLIDEVLNAAANEVELDLEQAAYLLSTFGYPETDHDACRAYLDHLAVSVRRQMTGTSPVEALIALNTVLFEHEQYRGAVGNFYSPLHTYIGPLLERREGIPITLSVLYMLVAKRLGIELHGIGMPLHFLVYHPELDVFIDCFNAGAFISRDECKRFIEYAGFTFNETMLQRRGTIEIVARMMRNAIYAHTKAGQQWAADTLQEAHDTIIHLTS